MTDVKKKVNDDCVDFHQIPVYPNLSICSHRCMVDEK